MLKEYLEPVERILRVGRRLRGTTFSVLVFQLRPNEVLVGYYDRRAFQIAPRLYNEARFNAFESQVAGKTLFRIAFYAVPLAELSSTPVVSKPVRAITA